MPKVYLLDVCKHIINLQSEINGERASTGAFNVDTGTLLCDCRDYCMFKVLDLLGTKTKTDLKAVILELNECESLCNSKGDKMHAVFFFTLSQMLALKHEVQTLPGEAITRKDFEDSWRKTRRELGI
ncbi:MAG: hypothetical protein IMF19_09055 [Proteobacteria bacterium]|nr:hypothetical protein [Pseudomonadota bacterium]